MNLLSVPPAFPPHRKVRVDLGPRSYEVWTGRNVLTSCASWISAMGIKGPVALISDDTVAGLLGQRMEHQLAEAGLRPFLLKVPAGESSKSMSNVAELLSALAQQRVPRSGTVLALGGGVIGDLAGFVAATYLRGIALVQVPTTLLAMVDSSVGGKTGVNLSEGKNLVGAFHQPQLVIVDLETLQTLPAREFAAGMAEVIKYGAIGDQELFQRVAQGVSPHDDDLAAIVEKCVALKARLVERDEFETKGERALLNFGHTIGHAIEKAGGYQTYLHGEAISLGLRAAAWLSVWQCGLPESEAQRIEAALTANALPLTLKSEIDPAAILGALGNDKKVAADGRNRWVLIETVGRAKADFEIPGELVEKAVARLSAP